MDAVEYMKQYAECDRKAKRSLAEYKAECEAIESMMPLPKNLRPGMDALVSYTETLKARAETSIRKRDDVLSMINRVPGIERDILVARHVDGLKCEDVAIKYLERYNALVRRYDETKAKLDETADRIRAKEARSIRLSEFIRTLREQETAIMEFDEKIWGSLVDFVTVRRGREMTVTFRDGTEITIR